MEADRRARVLDLLCVVALFAVGAHLRLGRLDAALVNGDAIGPYWKASVMLRGGGWIPRPHAVESGPALYWLYALFVAGADSLRDAYAARFAAQAAVGPLGYLAVRQRTGPLWALLAGGWFVAAVGLRQTLESGYQGYLAIEVAALIVAAFAVGARHPWALCAGLIAIPVAMMCHPFAVAYLPVGVALAVAAAWTRPPARLPVAVGLGGALAVSIPRIRQLLRPAFDSGTFDASALRAIPASNDTGAAAVDVILGSLQGIPGHGGAWELLPLSLLAVATMAVAMPRLRAVRAPVLAAAGTALALMGVGAAIGYLQPYHWRIVSPAVVAALGVLAASLGRIPKEERWIAACLALLIGRGLLPWGPPPPAPSELARTAAVAGIVGARPGGWVEFGTVGPRMWGSPVAVRLEQTLRRGPVVASERAPVHLVLAGSADALAPLSAIADVRGAEVVKTLPGGPDSALLVVRMADARASSAWTRRACAVAPLRIERRAIDYLGFERPELTEPFISMWWDDCTGANVGW